MRAKKIALTDELLGLQPMAIDLYTGNKGAVASLQMVSDHLFAPKRHKVVDMLDGDDARLISIGLKNRANNSD